MTCTYLMLVRNKIVDPFHDLKAANRNNSNSVDPDEMQHNCTVFKGKSLQGQKYK